MEDQKPDKAALDKAIQDANNTKQGTDEQGIADSIRVKEEPRETDLDANSTNQSVDEQSMQQSKPNELITVKQEPQETDQGYWNQSGKNQRQVKRLCAVKKSSQSIFLTYDDLQLGKCLTYQHFTLLFLL